MMRSGLPEFIHQYITSRTSIVVLFATEPQRIYVSHISVPLWVLTHNTLESTMTIPVHGQILG